MATHTPPDPGADVESILADHLARRAPGAPAEIEELCRQWPEHAAALRALYASYAQIEARLRAHRAAGAAAAPLVERLEAAYGAGVDPGVSIAGGFDAAAAGSPTSALLERLRRHAAFGTRYRLEGEVARGGMGAILKIWDEELRRHLAMKVVLGRLDAASPEGTPPLDHKHLARFLEEAQVTGQLEHPGIVPVHELGLSSDGKVYFTMRLVRGEDLRQTFEHVATGAHGWNQTRAVGVLLKVCEAMSYAHDMGVIHRDLKPANVMVGRYGEVYVMDWGLARILGREDRHDLRLQPAARADVAISTQRREEREGTPDSPLVTLDGDVLGTPAFMPPEQARGELAALGPHSDVYAVGAILYELLAGHMPFVEKHESPGAWTVLSLVNAGPPRSLFEAAPHAPSELIAICDKAMARDPRARYQRMTELAEDLRAYLERRVVHAYETGPWAEAKKWIVRNQALATALAAALVLLVAGLTTSLVFRARAVDQAAIATRRAEDVLSLSAIQDLQDLVERADQLWPAHPENSSKYQAWLADARLLVEGCPEDASRNQKRRPSLAEYETKLAELRARAQPTGDEAALALARAHPRRAALEQKRAELRWMSRMLGLEPWPGEDEVEAELAREAPPSDARALNELVWPLVAPEVAAEERAHGDEVKALLLARRAVAAAASPDEPAFRVTLSWAAFRAGRFDEALDEGRLAVAEAALEVEGELAERLVELEAAVDRWEGAEALNERRAERVRLSGEVEDRAIDVGERVFAASEDRWWHAQLRKLVTDLKGFRDEATGLLSAGLSPEYGWGVDRRAEEARTIRERSLDGAEAQRLWTEALAALAASDRYRNVAWPNEAGLKPQMGLLPIGVDPRSGLWEFAHLQSGAPPRRGSDGQALRDAAGGLELEETTGLVLVLIPGGTFWMGAQSVDPKGRNFDRQAQHVEAPVHEVTLAPYFLSKYEMTQAQWQMFVGRNPSAFVTTTGSGDLLHPVEHVSWSTCVEVLPRLGLSLPTEAQWELACRGGTNTPWWTGQERESLRGKVNLADRTARRAGATWPGLDDWPDLDDGWSAHAQVGTLAANPFGLHEVHGNLWEWCLDGFFDDYYRRSGDAEPLSPPATSATRAVRGGSFAFTAADARSSLRIDFAPDYHDSAVGIRPAKAVAP